MKEGKGEGSITEKREDSKERRKKERKAGGK